MNHQHQSQKPAQASSKASVEPLKTGVPATSARESSVTYLSEDADGIIASAINILAERMRRPGYLLSDPNAAKDYLRLRMAGLEHEEFHVLFLDVKNRLLASKKMFTGTLTHTSVYPREVVKAALHHNAASVMLAHNHPSGASEPSDADLRLTQALVQALALVDVRVLDHLIVAGVHAHSFAENGQL